MNTLRTKIIGKTKLEHGLWKWDLLARDLKLTSIFKPEKDYPDGQEIPLSFAENEVFLTRNKDFIISLDNRISCVVSGYEEDQTLVRVELQSRGGHFYAVTTLDSAHQLMIRPGLEIQAWISSLSFFIAKGGMTEKPYLEYPFEIGRLRSEQPRTVPSRRRLTLAS